MAPPHKYPAEYRAHAVEPWRTSGKSQRAVATELGISNELLRQWIRRRSEGAGRVHLMPYGQPERALATGKR